MPSICTNAHSPGGCSHYDVVIDGVTLHLHASDLTPLSDEERATFYRLAVRHKGLALNSLTARVIHGDEATNVKLYSFFGPGASITRTNIGTTYVNICPGANGERLIADFTGCTEFRLMLHANLVGAGQFGARIVRDSDNAVLIENAALGAAGERELDTGWVALPQGFVGSGIVALRAQAKSTTATDDPVFRSLCLGLR